MHSTKRFYKIGYFRNRRTIRVLRIKWLHPAQKIIDKGHTKVTETDVFELQTFIL